MENSVPLACSAVMDKNKVVEITITSFGPVMDDCTCNYELVETCVRATETLIQRGLDAYLKKNRLTIKFM